MVTVNEKKGNQVSPLEVCLATNVEYKKIKSKRRLLEPMGKINGEKSDCCLRNLRNTCTFEKERERERERERSTLCTFFNQILKLYIFTSFHCFC